MEMDTPNNIMGFLKFPEKSRDGSPERLGGWGETIGRAFLVTS